jgi:UDP-N-acetylmuramoyl-tripeptide--D-alanyl-D-alanine ligase
MRGFMPQSTPLWTAEEAARATGGKAVGNWQATSVMIDSRAVKAGALFIALKGENQDGHRYLPQALAAGAAAVVVSDPSQLPSPDSPHLHVADSLEALRELAKAARARMGGKLVGVTGSVGKTSTRAMLAAALSAHGLTHATEGNLNNHYGAPLTLARMPRESRFAVIEMGMNHADEIRPLSRLARPHLAIITAVEAVHLEHFPNVEGIADAKAEIMEGLEPGGMAILPAHNPHAERLYRHARQQGAQIIRFSPTPMPGVEACLLDATADGWGQQARARILGEEVSFSLPHPGRHMAENAVAVLAAVAALGLPLGPSCTALAGAELVEGRGAPMVLALPQGGHAVLIDDSYNASPASMRAAFAVLAMAQPAGNGRRLVALGDMLELGPEGPAMHRDLAEPLCNAGVDGVFVSGTLMQELARALPAAMRLASVGTALELAPIIRQNLRDGDVLLLKGSHGSQIYRLVEALRG